MKSSDSAGPGPHEPGLTAIARHETVNLSGRVVPGNGKSSFHVARYSELIREALGADMVEGSLNIILKHPVMLSNDTAQSTCFANEKPHFYWPGQLHGTDVWLYRWQSAPLHIVELLATEHLRTHLNLADGDAVEIKARKCDIGHISGLGRLTWVLLWWGRTQSTYANERHYIPAQRWGKQFGATQLGTKNNFWDLAAALTQMAVKKIK
jgi:hypothetical protein